MISLRTWLHRQFPARRARRRVLGRYRSTGAQRRGLSIESLETRLFMAHDITIAAGGLPSVPTGATTFSDTGDYTIDPGALETADITLKANTDITFQSSVFTSYNLTASAGRSIIIDGVSVVAYTQNLSLTADDTTIDGVVSADRDSGAATIDEVSSAGQIAAYSGNVSLSISTGSGLSDSTSANINLSSVDAGGTLTVNNEGPTAGSSIVEVANNATTISAASASFAVFNGSGSVGTASAPLLLAPPPSGMSLAASAGSDGACFQSTANNLTVGPVGGFDGIVAGGGGDVLIDSAGPLTIADQINTTGSVYLSAPGTLAETLGGSITADQLDVNVVGTSTGSNLVLEGNNAVFEFAASNNIAGGSITLNDTINVVVSNITSPNASLVPDGAGVSAAGGDVNLAAAGGMTLFAPISAGAGTVRLVAGGNLTEGALPADIISAARLSVRGSGGVSLANVNNITTTIAARYNAAQAPLVINTTGSPSTTAVIAAASASIDPDDLFTSLAGESAVATNSYAVAAGSQFLVNGYTLGDQQSVKVASDAAGDYVVVWQSPQDNSGTGIYASRYNSKGTQQGPTMLVNTFTTGNQSHPSVAMDDEGDFVVTWQSYGEDGSGYGIYAQLYNAGGSAVGGEFRVNASTQFNQLMPSVAMDGSGDFVVTWDSSVGLNSYQVYAQRYTASAAAIGSAFAVSFVPPSRLAEEQDVAMDRAGDFVIAWSHVNATSGYDIYASLYSAAGTLENVAWPVNTYTTGAQTQPSVAMDAAGDYVVAWQSYGQDGSRYGIYAQQFSRGGAASGAAFRVNSSTTANQASPAIGMDSVGDFVIAWQSYAQDGSYYGVYAQRYQGSGAALGNEFQVNTTTSDSQFYPAVAMDSAGDMITAWVGNNQDGSGYGVFAQAYRQTSAPVASTLDTALTYTEGTAAVAIAPSLSLVDGESTTITSATVTISSGYDASNDVLGFTNQAGITGLVSGNTLVLSGSATVAAYQTALRSVKFSTLNPNPSATPRVITFIANDGTPGVTGVSGSRTVNVTPGAATHLAILGGVPSPSVEAGVNFNVTVAAEDAQGNIATSDSGVATLGFSSPGGATLYGPTSLALSSGVAVFSGLSIRKASLGDSFTFTGSNPSVASASSTTFSVTAVSIPNASTLSAGEILVNTYTNGAQQTPAIATDAAGDYVVVWASAGEDGSGYGIYAQRYSASGIATSSEFQVNTYTTGNQVQPAVAMDAAGDFVVAWASNLEDGSGYGVYARRYNSAGVAQSGEIKVNTYTNGDQKNPAVAMNASGAFVVTWQSAGQDGGGNGIDVQIYGAGGATSGGEIRVNTYTTGNQQFPSIGMDQAGDFAIAWESYGEDGSQYGVYARQFNASGGGIQATEFSVNAAINTNQQILPSVAMDAAGDFVVSWVGYVPTVKGYDIYARRYNSAGAGQAAVAQSPGGFVVNTYTNTSLTFATAQQMGARVAMDYSGDFVVAWSSLGQDGSGYGVYSQRYNFSGTAVGNETRINTYTTGSQRAPAVAMSTPGSFAVAWQSSGEDSSSYGIYAQEFFSPGTTVASPSGSEFGVNTYTTASQVTPAIATDAAGDYVVVWASSSEDGSGYGVYGQRYNAAGAPQGAEFRVNTYTAGNQLQPAVAMDATGDFVVTWAGNLEDGSGYGVYAQRYNSSGVAQGGEFRANTYTTGAQRAPAVAMNASGAFVITWESLGQDGSGYGIYAQRYNSAGTAQGGEFAINAYTTGIQQLPSIAMDQLGDFVVAWESYGEDGSKYGIYARQFNSSGTAVQPIEFNVNAGISTNQQILPSVAMDASGDFVVSWVGYVPTVKGYDIYARRYNAAGTAQTPSGFVVNTFTNTSLTFANAQGMGGRVAMDSSGDFVVTWAILPEDGSSFGVYAQRYNFAGGAVGGETQINTYTFSGQRAPAVAMSTSGDFAVAWQGNSEDGSAYGIYAQEYLSPGATSSPATVAAPNGTEFRVNTYTTGAQVTPAVATDSVGDYVVVWASSGEDGSGYGIYAQRYNALGVPQGAETKVNTYTTGNQVQPAVAMDAAGDYVVVWAGAGTGDSYGIFAQRYSAGGALLGGNVLVNSYTTGTQQSPAVAMDSAGDFVVAWAGPGTGDSYGIFAQRYNSAGTAQGGNFLVNTFTTGNQKLPSIGMDSTGDFVIAWESAGEDSSGYGIYAQRYNSSAAAQGSEFQVNTAFTSLQQMAPSVAMDSTGDFVVSWIGYVNSTTYGIYARRFTSAGAALSASAFLVNTLPLTVNATTAALMTTKVGMDAAGDFVIAWSSYGADGAGFGIGVQRYNSTGQPLGKELRVNSYTAGNQLAPSAAMDSVGDFTVAWESNAEDGGGYGIYAQRYLLVGLPGQPQGSSGSPNPLVVSATTTLTTKLASDAAGDTVIVWSAPDANGNGIFAETFSASGVASAAFQVNTYTTGGQIVPSVAMDAEGDFVVVWESNQDGGSYGIYAQRYSRTGAALGSEFRVNTYTTGKQLNPDVAMDAAGDFVIVWQSYGEDGSKYGIYAQLYTAAGNKLGSEFLVNTYTTQSQSNPSVAMDTAGDFVVAWQSYNEHGAAAAGYGVFAQLYKAGGALQGSEFQVNTYTNGPQTTPAVAMDSYGDFVVAWQSIQDGAGYGIYAQLYKVGGATSGGEFLVNSYTFGNQITPQVGMDAYGDFTVAWASYTQDGSHYGTYAQRYLSTGAVLGSAFLVNNITGGSETPSSIAEDATGDFLIAWQGDNGSFVQRDVFATPLAVSNTITNVSYTLPPKTGAVPQPILTYFGVNDGASTVVTGATVSISSGFNASQDTLAGTGVTGISVAYNAATGVLTLSGTATAAAYQQVLDSVTYLSSSTIRSLAPRTITVQVSDGITTTSSTETVNLVPGAPTQLVILSSPLTGLNAASTFNLTVDVEDSNGYIVTGYDGSIYLSLSSNPAQALLSGPTSVAATAGVAVFSGVGIEKAGTGYKIQATSGMLTAGTTATFSIAPAAATQLVVSSQPPGTVVSAVPFGLSVVAEDAYGNLATSFTGKVTLAIANNPSSGTLGGTTSVTASAGIALFSGLSLDKVGNGYTLSATAKNVSSATTGGITVTPGAPAQLVVSTQPPASVSAGSPFSVAVTAEDAQGNFTPSYNGTATFELYENGVYDGTSTVNFVNGVATDPALSIFSAGTGYSYSVLGAGVGSTATKTFTVTPGTATQLSISTPPPGGVVAGAPFTLIATALDAYGNIATSFGGLVRTVIQQNPNGAVLGGSTIVYANAGVATFSGLTLDKVGTGYTLEVLSGTLATDTSASISVSPGQASQLVIVTQPPGSMTVGLPFGVSVVAEDAEGNLVPSFQGNITVSLATNAGGGTLSGMLTEAASGGQAVFSGLSLNNPADGYQLGLSSDGLATADSALFNVLPSGNTLSLSGLPGQIVAVTFSDPTHFSVSINGGTPASYSTSQITNFTYTGPSGAFSQLVFNDPFSTDAYSATQSLASTTLTRADASGFVFNAVGVKTLYVYLADPSSVASISVAGGQGNNFYVADAADHYSYIADPIAGIYSELVGFGSETAAGSFGSTYAYLYSAPHALVVESPTGTSLSVGTQSLALSGFPTLFTVGSADGTDQVTLDSAGGSLVATPNYSYVSTTNAGTNYFLGALYCAQLVVDAASAADTATFYSYPQNALTASPGNVQLTGQTVGTANSGVYNYAFNLTAEGYANPIVFQSGSGTDTASLSVSGAATLVSTPTVSTLTYGSGSITINTFFAVTSTDLVAVPSSISVQGDSDSAETASVTVPAGNNQLIVGGSSAALTTPVSKLSISQFGHLTVDGTAGTRNSIINESAIDYALATIGDWQNAPIAH